MAKTRFYKYFFSGVEKPIIMEAEKRTDADKMLGMLGQKSNVAIDLSKLIDVRIETPLVGISKRRRGGNDYIWVGKENSSDGWILQSEFEKIENLNKNNGHE